MKHLRTPILLVVFLALFGCTTSAKVVTASDGPTIDEIRAARAEGPLKRVALKPFEVKAAGAHGEIGGGLSDMMAAALTNTGLFIVMERERLSDVESELALADDPRFRRETVAPRGQLEGAELVILGSITEFEPDCRGFSLLLFGGKQACATLNLRIVDVATGRVVNATTVQGKSGTNSVGLIFTTSPLPVGLGAWSKTPMESAVREMIETAVRHVVETQL